MDYLDWFYRLKRDNWTAYLNLISFMILDADQAFEEPMLPHYRDLLQRLDYLNQLGDKRTLEETSEMKDLREDIELMDAGLDKVRKDLPSIT
jgi:hypothetical protein